MSCTLKKVDISSNVAWFSGPQFKMMKTQVLKNLSTEAKQHVQVYSYWNVDRLGDIILTIYDTLPCNYLYCFLLVFNYGSESA